MEQLFHFCHSDSIRIESFSVHTHTHNVSYEKERGKHRKIQIIFSCGNTEFPWLEGHR